MEKRKRKEGRHVGDRGLNVLLIWPPSWEKCYMNMLETHFLWSGSLTEKETKLQQVSKTLWTFQLKPPETLWACRHVCVSQNTPEEQSHDRLAFTEDKCLSEEDDSYCFLFLFFKSSSLSEALEPVLPQHVTRHRLQIQSRLTGGAFSSPPFTWKAAEKLMLLSLCTCLSAANQADGRRLASESKCPPAELHPPQKCRNLFLLSVKLPVPPCSLLNSLSNLQLQFF